MSKQLGLLLSDTSEQLQLELHRYIQQATTNCTRIAKGLCFPLVYPTANASPKAIKEASVNVTE